MSDKHVFHNTEDQGTWKQLTVTHDLEPLAVQVSLTYAWGGVTAFKNATPAHLHSVAAHVGQANKEAAALLEHLAGLLQSRQKED